MLRSISLASSLFILSLGTASASLQDVEEQFGDDNQQPTSLIPYSPKQNAFEQWTSASLLERRDGRVFSTSVIRQLASDIALINDMSYSVGKKFACDFFMKNANTYGVTDLTQLKSKKLDHNKNLFGLMRDLADRGWEPALGSIEESIIYGKSGSKRLDNSKDVPVKVDNHAGIVLYHKPTGTLLPVFHGSRGDDYLPYHYDWDANLHAELETVVQNGYEVDTHSGFNTTALSAVPSVVHILGEAMHRHKGVKRVLFTGHSHGAGVSELACYYTITDHGPQLSDNGNFNNAEENFFSFYGLSHPAGVAHDSIEGVRERVGRENFLSVGVQHDPVIQLFRSKFWKECGTVISSENLQVMKAFANSAGLSKVAFFLDVLDSSTHRPDYEHIGYLANESFKDVLRRQSTTGAMKTLVHYAAGTKNDGLAPKNLALTMVAGVHYGGEHGLYDRRLAGQIGNKLDDMLLYANTNQMTFGQYVQDIAEIPAMLSQDAQDMMKSVADTAVKFDQAVDEAGPAVQAIGTTAAIVGGGLLIDSIIKDRQQKKKNGEESEIGVQEGAAVLAVGAASYGLWKLGTAAYSWWNTPSETNEKK